MLVSCFRCWRKQVIVLLVSIATNGREAEEDVLVIREQRIDELNHDSFSYQSVMMLLDHLLVESSFVFFVLQNQPSKLAGPSRIFFNRCDVLRNFGYRIVP